MNEDQKTNAELQKEKAELQKTILKMGEKMEELEKWFTHHITALQKRDAKRKAENLTIQRELNFLKRKPRG